jgi:spermidine synthase
MIPFRLLAQTRTPRGDLLSLHEHDTEYFLKLNGRALMNSTGTASEVLLAELACKGAHPAPRILIGGLGMGFTLKRVLEIVGPQAEVHVAELFPEVIAWYREFLTGLNGPILDEPRVKVVVADVFQLIRDGRNAKYDAILLDVDNGPIALVAGRNARLYEGSGFKAIRRALQPGGRVAFWSASDDAPFARRLSSGGFSVETIGAKSHPTAKRLAHRIYVATPLAERLAP